MSSAGLACYRIGGFGRIDRFRVLWMSASGCSSYIPCGEGCICTLGDSMDVSDWSCFLHTLWHLSHLDVGWFRGCHRLVMLVT